MARLADQDPTGWRNRARDPAIRANQAALVELVKSAPVAEESGPLLVALSRQLKPDDPERLPFLKRIHKAHPRDFRVNVAARLRAC